MATRITQRRVRELAVLACIALLPAAVSPADTAPIGDVCVGLPDLDPIEHAWAMEPTPMTVCCTLASVAWCLSSAVLGRSNSFAARYFGSMLQSSGDHQRKHCRILTCPRVAGTGSSVTSGTEDIEKWESHRRFMLDSRRSSRSIGVFQGRRHGRFIISKITIGGRV